MKRRDRARSLARLLACLLACLLHVYASIHVIVRPAPTNGPYLLRVAVEHFAYDMRALRWCALAALVGGEALAELLEVEAAAAALEEDAAVYFRVAQALYDPGLLLDLPDDDERGDALRVAVEPPSGLSAGRLEVFVRHD